MSFSFKHHLIAIQAIIPGLMICITIGLFSKWLGTFFPSLGAATIAILLGLLLGNTVFNQGIWHKGVRYSESTLLSYSIVLLGGTLSYSVILELGFTGVLFIILQMLLTIIFCLVVGKKLGFSENFRILMATGNAVCGSSAIGATAPVIKANEIDKSISITLVNLTGTILMMVLPFLASSLFQNETLQSSALIGGVLQSVGQVVGSAAMVNDVVKDTATIFKIVRIIFLVFIIIGFAKLKSDEFEEEHETKPSQKQNSVKIPWYVIGFFIMCFAFSIGLIPQHFSIAFKSISHYLEIFALAGIGMSVKFKDLMRQGIKSGVYCLAIGVSQVIFALGLIWLIF